MKVYSLDIREALCKLSYRNKYDMMSNEIAKQIFEAVVSGKTNFFKDYPEYGMEVIATVDRLEDEYIEKVKGHEYTHFNVAGYNAGSFDEDKAYDSCQVCIRITISKKFSDKDYRSLNYSLYEIIRHEIEHQKTFVDVGYPEAAYSDLFNKTFEQGNTPLKEFCQLMSKYILDPQELPSYAKSIYYLAKKQNRDFKLLIQETLFRALFNNDPRKITDGMDNPEILTIYNNLEKNLVESVKGFYPRSMVKMIHI